jgi:predicted PurR-regulated permease PerM
MTNSLFKGTQIILLTVLSITILYFGKEVLAPLAMAGILAMLFLGPSTFFEKKGMPRWSSALIAIVCLLVICSGIIFLLNWQLQSFAEQLVDMKKTMGGMDYLNQ